jgi:FKBP-type peptidyl-prolyl cis-trans isomerase FkpA/FKBP-type peptidyl-prolyl cis-trans isomerase FklB
MRYVIFLCAFLFVFNCSQKQELPFVQSLNTKTDTISYSLGADIGENLKRQQIDFDYDALITGLVDAYETNQVKLDQTERRKAMMDLQQLIRDKATETTRDNLEEADAFLAKNKVENTDVKETPTGLQYRVLRQGGGNSPSGKDKVKVHYAGRLLNGQEFDSSIARGNPAEFTLDRVIKGWTEGLQLMKEGDKFEFFIHPRLGYGNRSTPKIPGNSCLIFEVELIEVLEG